MSTDDANQDKQITSSLLPATVYRTDDPKARRYLEGGLFQNQYITAYLMSR